MFGLSRRERLMSALQSVIDDWRPRRSTVNRWSDWARDSMAQYGMRHRKSRMEDLSDSMNSYLHDAMSAARRGSRDVARAGASTAQWATEHNRLRILALVAGLGFLAYMAGRKT